MDSENGRYIYRRYSLKQSNRNIKDKIVGLDTETLHGYCKLISSFGDDFVKQELINSLDDVLEFLTYREFRESINFFYNLGYDIESILKYLSRDKQQEIVITNKTTYRDYKLFYIKDKFFRILKGKKSFKFYDLQQYYNTSLSQASRQYLNENKLEYDVKNLTYKDINSRELQRYNLKDSELCYKLAKLLHTNLNQVIKTDSYISCAHISQKYFVNKGLKIFKLDDKTLRYFFNSYFGGRFEIFKKGYIKYAREYDIKSCYPFHMTRMPILSRDFKVYHATCRHDDCLYGAYHIRINNTDFDYVGLIPFKLRNNILSFANLRNIDYYVDKDTLDVLHDMDVDYEFVDGVVVYDNKYSYFLKDIIEMLYYFKEYYKDKNKMLSYCYKIILNSLYGKFIEKHEIFKLENIKNVLKFNDVNELEEELDYIFNNKLDGADKIKIKTNQYILGSLFNCIYACFITSNARLQLFNTIKNKNHKYLYSFATDSILCDFDIDTGNSLGDFELTSEGELILVKSGCYQIDKKIRNRGIKRFMNILDDKVILNRRYSLKHACHKNYDKINLIEHREYNIDFNNDSKRLFKEKITKNDILNKRYIDSEILTIVN